MVTQGFGGTGSHRDKSADSLYHSLDLTYGSSSVYGATVLAHSTGVVVDFRESVLEGASASTGSTDPSLGPSSLGNFVTVHYASSGLYVTYAHLQYNGVVPSIGQTVNSGDALGFVGNTGARTGTHLHVTYGFDTFDPAWSAGIVADGSKLLGTPVSFDTANGQIGPGIVSEISFDLTSQTLAADRHHLYLMGSSSINGYGDSYSNLISGNRGNNILDGRSGNDTLLGGDGNDILIGGTGNDSLNGGGGIDTVSYSSAASGVSVNLGSSSQQYTGSTTGYDTVVFIENILGSAYSDTLTGNGLANRIDGGNGDDRIYGGTGNDLLDGGFGFDVIDGGSGVDTTSYVFYSGSISANLTAGVVSFPGNSTLVDTLISIENILSGSGNDIIVGSSVANLINAGNGSDIITGGGGADILIGGLGNDVFVFGSTADSNGFSRDVIRGDGATVAFSGAGATLGDRIDVSGIDANSTLLGNQFFRFGLTGIGTISLAETGTSTLVRGNTDYDADYEFILAIEDGSVRASSYTAADFFL